MILITKLPTPDFFSSDEVQKAIATKREEESADATIKRQRRSIFRFPYLKQLKQALSDESHGKCVYCEQILTGIQALQVDHYRPYTGALDQKGNRSKEHYYWLAYEWTNMFACCADCNGAKGSTFPVASHRSPIGVTSDLDAIEQPRLINPFRVNPSEHLRFFPNGIIDGITAAGRETIAILKLNRLHLVERRAERARALFRDLSASRLDISLEDTIEFAGMVRQLYSEVVKNPKVLDEFRQIANNSLPGNIPRDREQSEFQAGKSTAGAPLTKLDAPILSSADIPEISTHNDRSGVALEESVEKNPNQRQGSENTEKDFGAYAKHSISVEKTAERDLLNRENLTNALHSFLTERNEVAPLAIALFGHWGAGKTSLIDLLIKRLSAPGGKRKIEVIKFNAWHHEQVANPAAALAQTIVESIVEDKSMFEEALLAWRLRLKFQKKRTGKSGQSEWRKLWRWLSETVWKKFIESVAPFILRLGVIFSFWPIQIGLFIAVAVPLFYFFKAEQNEIIAGIYAILPGGILTWLVKRGADAEKKLVADNLTEWFKKLNWADVMEKFQMPDYKVHLGLYHEIHRTLKALCEIEYGADDATNTTSLLVIVDDLDRCSPKMVKAMFDAIRLVADINKVTTLVAIDERIAYAAVKRYFVSFGKTKHAPERYARDYLAKVFGLAVTLPKTDSTTIKRFVFESLFADQKNGAEGSVPPIISGASIGRGQEDISDGEEVAQAAPPEKSLPVIIEGDLAPKTISFLERAPHSQALPSYCDGERELFADLAQVFNFHNPRQLWRLRQSWQLCKHLYFDEKYWVADIQAWLKTLFWCEWWLTQNADEKKKWTQPNGDMPSFDPKAGFDFRTELMPTAEQFEKCKIGVQAIILPGAPDVD